ISQCALWPTNIWVTQQENQEKMLENTLDFLTCTRHVQEVRNYLTNHPEEKIFSSGNKIDILPIVKNDTKKLEISFEKDSFVKYEPIVVKLKYINNTNTFDSIYNLFDE